MSRETGHSRTLGGGGGGGVCTHTHAWDEPYSPQGAGIAPRQVPRLSIDGLSWQETAAQSSRRGTQEVGAPPPSCSSTRLPATSRAFLPCRCAGREHLGLCGSSLSTRTRMYAGKGS